jgi:hypothetical protein
LEKGVVWYGGSNFPVGWMDGFVVNQYPGLELPGE